MQDTVLSGNPGGAIFSLFTCDSIPLGIHDNKMTSNYHFFPNPLVNETILSFPLVKQKATFTLFNLNGQLVKTVGNITEGEVRITRDGIVSGIYCFMLKTDERVIATGKLIVE